MSLYTGLQLDHTLAGIVCMSGYLPKHDSSFQVNAKAVSTPVWHFHGAEDPVVKATWARASAELLRSLGVDYSYTEHPGLEHSACQEEVDALEDFLRRVLPS